MSPNSPQPYLWKPAVDPDPIALDRMAQAFSKPKSPMGEAWFMGTDREMFPQLFGNLDLLPDDDIARSLEEITSGTSSFGQLEEWTEWYHYLLPRLIRREWVPTFYQPAERLITAFMTQYATSHGSQPYPNFQTDALNTLGRYIMSSHFWSDGQLDAVNCLSKWTGPTGIAGWSKAGNLLSASLFFCIKYLPRSDVDGWFRSVVAIGNSYWQLQVITWLVGAHPILTGKIQQPSEFPEDASVNIEWDWSHILDGNYSRNHEPQALQIPFLPAENCKVVLQIAGKMEVEEFLEGLWTDPKMNAITSEAAGIPESFLQLYRTNRSTD